MIAARWAGAALAVLAASAAFAQNGPQLRNFEAPGNLEATVVLGCIPFDKARPIYTPVDLYKAARACIADRRFDDAVPLFTLAGVYGRYDALRVADPAARSAAAAARAAIFLDVVLSDNDAFQAAARKRLDPMALPAMCADIRKLGPPAYYPRYMVRHGMAIFGGAEGDGLLPGFDPVDGWAKALDSYLHCPD